MRLTVTLARLLLTSFSRSAIVLLSLTRSKKHPVRNMDPRALVTLSRHVSRFNVPAQLYSPEILSSKCETSRCSQVRRRPFSFISPKNAEGRDLNAARGLERKGAGKSGEHDHDEAVAQEKEKQTRAPWHRQGSELPPVARPRSAGAMTKGMVCDQAHRWRRLMALRQAAHDAIAFTQAHHTPHNARSELRQERRRASRPASSPFPAAVLLGAIDTIRASTD